MLLCIKPCDYLKDHLFPIVSAHLIRLGRMGMIQVPSNNVIYQDLGDDILCHNTCSQEEHPLRDPYGFNTISKVNSGFAPGLGLGWLLNF